MTGLAALGWGIALWMAAGVEAAWGGGSPGPMLLLAVAAGLRLGPAPGLVLGALAGLCETALFGGSFLLNGMLGLLCGAGAAGIARICAPRNMLVGVGAALLLSFPVSLLAGWTHFVRPADAALAALWRSGENALWMIPIYGIVLLAYRGVAPAKRGD